jgi:hypothetical protein
MWLRQSSAVCAFASLGTIDARPDLVSHPLGSVNVRGKYHFEVALPTSSDTRASANGTECTDD